MIHDGLSPILADLVQPLANAGVDGVARHPVKDGAPPRGAGIVLEGEGGLASKVSAGSVTAICEGRRSGDT